MKQNNHNTHFYSIQEVERCLKSTEDFEDGEQLFYFIGALRYVYDENKKKDKEIERLNNIINEYENMKKELLDYIYHNEYCRFGHIDGGEADEMRNILNRTDKLKELKESGNNE